jgi:hypothetical protein
MKLVKRILFLLVGVIALALLAAAIMRKDYAVEREIVINKPKQEVYDYMKLLKNQDNYSKWNQVDPGMKKYYKGTDGEVGFVAGWDSANEQVGAGEQEIVKIVPGERIDLALRFTRPFVTNDNAYLILESLGEAQTKVKWGFNGKMPYPMNLMLPIMGMEKMLGDDLNVGLAQAKPIIEALTPPPPPAPDTLQVPLPAPAMVK